MKKRLLMLICILCTMAIFVGGTLAYFTDSVTATAEIKSAMIDIEQIEMERQVNKKSLQDYSHDENNPIYLYPAVYSGELKTETLEWAVEKPDYENQADFELKFWSNVNNAVDKIVFVKNSSTTQAAFRTIYAFESYPNFDTTKLLLNRNTTNYTWSEIGPGNIQVDGETKTYYFMTATYKGELAIGEIATPSLLQVALSSKAGNEDIEKFGETYEILVVTQATQSQYDAPESVFSSDPKDIVEAVVNKYYKPENEKSPIYPPNESSTSEP